MWPAGRERLIVCSPNESCLSYSDAFSVIRNATGRGKNLLERKDLAAEETDDGNAFKPGLGVFSKAKQSYQ